MTFDLIKKEAEQVQSLSELAEDTIVLKCRKCKVEQHVPILEFVETAQKTPYRCKICPDEPELFVYKHDPFKVMMAGFVHTQKEMGIDDDTMKKMIGIAAESPLLKKKKTPKLLKKPEKKRLKK